MKKVIHKTPTFELYSNNRKNPNKRGIGPKFYAIECKLWSLEDEVSDMIDPLRNKGTKPRHWVYKDLEEARKHFTMLTLRWA